MTHAYLNMDFKNKYNWKGKVGIIAEDADNNYFLLKAFLAKTQITVLHAKDGQELVDLLKTTNNVDVVLMDIRMPVMNGYEALKQVKKINERIPVIAQTACAMYGDKEKIMAAGFDDYIAKPFDRGMILEKMRRYLV